MTKMRPTLQARIDAAEKQIKEDRKQFNQILKKLTERLDALAEPKEVLASEFDYFMFEQRYRGSITDIRDRQAKYLSTFKGKTNVLDLGCGRGEFLELLAAKGIPVTGVDMNASMVAFCRDRGLPAEQADAFTYLAGLPDRSVDGIFMAQLVEHLTPRKILHLVNLCADKLMAGGVIVMETINPACLEGMSWFYLDPTHVRPVPPELLQFMLEQATLDIKCVKYSMPVAGSGCKPVLDVPTTAAVQLTQRALYQDYAVVAQRPPAPDDAASAAGTGRSRGARKKRCE